MSPKTNETISDYCARLLQHRMQLDGAMKQITDQILIMGRVRTGRVRKERAAARKGANIAPAAGWIITTRKNADAARRRRTVVSMRAATASIASKPTAGEHEFGGYPLTSRH